MIWLAVGISVVSCVVHLFGRYAERYGNEIDGAGFHGMSIGLSLSAIALFVMAVLS